MSLGFPSELSADLCDTCLSVLSLWGNLGGLTLQLHSLNRVILLFHSEQLQVRLVDLLGSVQSVDLAAKVSALILPMKFDLMEKHNQHDVPRKSQEVLTSATLYKFF